MLYDPKRTLTDTHSPQRNVKASALFTVYLSIFE